ncbi:MAG: ArnT family glycosyltransferase, partial [Thermoanaerobaculia bacterium]
MSVAFWGQLNLAGGGTVALATRCYAAGIVLWLLASPRSGLAGVPLLPRPLWLREPRPARLRRVVWLEIAIALCLCGVMTLRFAGYDSRGGALAWLASITILALAFREKPAANRVSAATPGERLSRMEVALFLFVVALAVFFRFHRLGDWLGGIHGDEGEAGLDALRVLRGEHVPPFGTGWFGQGNLYYWGVALGMKLGGTGLFGLRSFSALAGVLLIAPTYGLARRWFGPRVALLSAAFLAISDVAINFSRLEFSNVTTPLSIVAGFAFLFRGLRNGRLLSFLLAGFAHAAGLYFYQGARLTPLLGLAFLGYLLVISPLLAAPGGLRGCAGKRKLRRQVLRSRRLRVPALVYVVALLSFGAPFFAFSIDNRQQATERVKEKLVFNNEARMAASHKLEHTPLFVGLRIPRA